MNQYLIDSSIFIALLRGREDARDLLASLEGKILTSSICIAELYEGIYRSKKRVSNEKNLLTLLTTLDGILPFTVQETKLFGKLKALLKHKPIPDMDLQIAATCIQNDLILVTSDTRHFTSIPHLTMYKEKS